MKRIIITVLAVYALLSIYPAMAADELLKPFVLASKGPGNLTDKTEATKSALTTGGFNVVGSYSPYPTSNILIVTNDELITNAGESNLGGFGAAQRVALTKVKEEIQISYTNPEYMAAMYRMKGDLKSVAEKMKVVLGKIETFGAKGMTASEAKKYHYMFSMPYFDEPYVLAEYPTHEEAIVAVETGLAAGNDGVTRIYRIDISKKPEVVFGVAMAGKRGITKIDDSATAEKIEQFGPVMKGADEADQHIMSEIDFGEMKSTAHLPYEILVSGKQVLALHAKFRIAQSFPDLKMAGSHSFLQIMSSPDAIRKALQNTVTLKK